MKKIIYLFVVLLTSAPALSIDLFKFKISGLADLNMSCENGILNGLYYNYTDNVFTCSDTLTLNNLIVNNLTVNNTIRVTTVINQSTINASEVFTTNAYVSNKVGIGTTTPTEILEVRDNTPTILLRHNSNINDVNGTIAFRTDGSGEYASIIMSRDTSPLSHISFMTRSASNYAERIRIDGTGNVGIGTNAPSTVLELYGNSPNTTIQNLLETDTSITFTDAQDATQNGRLVYGSGSNRLFLINNNIEGISLDNYGNVNLDRGTLFVNNSLNAVGIGTTSPSQKLVVYGGSLLINNTGTISTDYKSLIIDGSLSAINAGRCIAFDRPNGNTMVSMCFTTDSVGNQGELVFKTATSTVFNATERMRIDNSGNVGIGITIPQSKFDIGSANAQFRIVDTDDMNYTEWSYSGNYLIARMNANSGNGVLTLTDTNRVGINIPASVEPHYVFTVNGNVSLNNTMHIENRLVGIRTTNPSFALDVNAMTRINSTLRLSTGLSDTGTIDFGLGDLIINVTNGDLTFFGYNAGYNHILTLDDLGKVGIGTLIPQTELDINKSQDTNSQIRIQNLNTGTSARASVGSVSTSGSISIQSIGQASTVVPAWKNSSVLVTSSKDLWISSTNTNNPMVRVQLNTSSSTGEMFRFLSNGNISMKSPDGTWKNCGVSNAKIWSCS